MAGNSTSRRRYGAILGALGVGVAAVLVSVALPASAHTPELSAKCADGKTVLKVELTRYNAQKANTVKITDGDTVLLDDEFSTDFKKSFNAPGDVKHEFVVDVKAWDDPEGKKGFTFTKKLPVAACVTPPTTTTKPTTTTAPSSSSSEEPSTPATTTTSAEEAPPLAETGASIALPLTIGALLLVGGGVLLFVVRRRGRA
jgi:LPXTG-motif cell wall-anchored protein